jgi:hypothetical protein
MPSNFFVNRYAEESNFCEYLLSELVVFNDPADDEYEEEESEAQYYLGNDLSGAFWIFANVAGGNVDTFLRLYYDTSRVDVVKSLAYSQTYIKIQNKRR